MGKDKQNKKALEEKKKTKPTQSSVFSEEQKVKIEKKFRERKSLLEKI